MVPGVKPTRHTKVEKIFHGTSVNIGREIRATWRVGQCQVSHFAEQLQQTMRMRFLKAQRNPTGTKPFPSMTIRAGHAICACALQGQYVASA